MGTTSDTPISRSDDRLQSLCDDAVQRISDGLVKAIDQHLATLGRSEQPVENMAAGVELPFSEQSKAAELRTAVLMGKVPQGTGLLLDAKATSQLLNVSKRTFARLHAAEAIPEPIRLAGKICRWRLAEVLAWIEADCPPRSHWKYPETLPETKRRR